MWLPGSPGEHLEGEPSTSSRVAKIRSVLVQYMFVRERPVIEIEG